MAGLFWFSDEQWAALEPFMPRNQPGAHRVDDRRIVSGIVHILRSGCRWRDCPAAYGPRTTVYNRFNRWARRAFWKAMLAALAKAGWAGDAAALDSTYVRAHRCFAKQDAHPKPRLLNVVLSNSTWKGGELAVRFQQPFDLLAETAVLVAADGGAKGLNSPGHSSWLGDVDSNHD